MSPLIALRERGLGARSGAAEVALSRSSVARSASSRALSSDVCVETSRFLEVVLVNVSAIKCRSRDQGGGAYFWSTAASRSAMLLSILNKSSKVTEKWRAMVDCGRRPLGFHSLSSSSSERWVTDIMGDEGMFDVGCM